MCYVYILYSHKNGRYYIGQTADLHDRLRRHNAGTERAVVLDATIFSF
ncbi:GIY-YIG nuclease family protein [Flavobacteriaceae bacterium 3-367]